MEIALTLSDFYYITTPIYYVNDIPHIGSAYTTIACDVMARFMRLDGKNVKFLTGTDEHGQKIAKAASVANKDPKAFVDEVCLKFQELLPALDISNDDFIRTTDARHIKAAQAMWKKLEDNGHIYLGKYAGWYDVRNEAFFHESELIDGKSPNGAPVEWVVEESYFFKLSAWQEPLLKFYEEHPDFIAPESRRNEVLSFVKGGLRDLSISRTSFSWGVPVPGNPDHIMYVWLDALTNYITALGYPDLEKSDFKNFWPQSHHVIGKDILRFHAVYWPAFLMAAGLQPPKRLFAHGWWTNEGQKISKSLGNTIDPHKLIEKYGVDPVRYFLIREIPFGNDGDFSEKSLTSRLNSDLANSLGNLVQRVLSFIYKSQGGILPTPSDFTKEDLAFLNGGKEYLSLIRREMDQQGLHKYCEALWRYISDANKYMDEQKPWSLKNTDPKRMETILYVLSDVIRRIALLVTPLIPKSADKILDQLAIPKNQRMFAFFDEALTPGIQLPEPQAIFPRYVEV